MKYIRHLTWVPAIWMMALIFGFSGETATVSSGLSTQVSKKIVEIGETLSGQQLSSDDEENVTEKIHVFVRKTAHFIEYAVLAVLLLIPVYISLRKKGKQLFILTEIISALYAVTDELHQLFIAGRACRVTDMLLDSAGAATGITCAILMYKFVYLIFERNKKNDKAVETF